MEEHRPQDQPPSAFDDATLLDALDEVVVGGLYVGLRLDDVLRMTDGEVRSRVELAVRDVDRCIDGVRRIALGLAGERGTAPGGTSNRGPDRPADDR